MPLQVVNGDRGRVERLLISCDACGHELDDQTIKDGGGLTAMGWKRQFNEETRRNEYFCPKHLPE